MRTKYQIGQELLLPHAQRPAGKTDICPAMIVGVDRPQGTRNPVYRIHVYLPDGETVERHDEAANISGMIRHVERMQNGQRWDEGIS
jgi:hypothetical protein